MIEGYVILGVHVTGRTQHVTQIQEVLTQFGCNIRTRLGLHDVDGRHCSPNGLLLLQVVGPKKAAADLRAALEKIEGVEVKSMAFDHP